VLDVYLRRRNHDASRTIPWTSTERTSSPLPSSRPNKPPAPNPEWAHTASIPSTVAGRASIPSKLAAPISPRERSSESGTTSVAMPSTVATATCSLSTVSAAPYSPPSFVSSSISRVYTLNMEHPTFNGKKLGVERK
jgi:hypothetical protein